MLGWGFQVRHTGLVDVLVWGGMVWHSMGRMWSLLPAIPFSLRQGLQLYLPRRRHHRCRCSQLPSPQEGKQFGKAFFGGWYKMSHWRGAPALLLLALQPHLLEPRTGASEVNAL